MGKNTQKVQDMLDGKHQRKIQVGAVPDNIHEGRKVGERWFDSDGKEWEQKNGYRTNITKLANKGFGDKRRLYRRSNFMYCRIFKGYS